MITGMPYLLYAFLIICIMHNQRPKKEAGKPAAPASVPSKIATALKVNVHVDPAMLNNGETFALRLNP